MDKKTNHTAQLSFVKEETFVSSPGRKPGSTLKIFMGKEKVFDVEADGPITVHQARELAVKIGIDQLDKATALIDRLEGEMEKARDLTDHCPGCGSWSRDHNEGCDWDATLAALEEWREGK